MREVVKCLNCSINWYAMYCTQCRKLLIPVVVEEIPLWQCGGCGAQYPREERESK